MSCRVAAWDGERELVAAGVSAARLKAERDWMFVVSEDLVYLLRASLFDQLVYSLDLEGWHVAFFDVHDFECALLDGYHFNKLKLN